MTEQSKPAFTSERIALAWAAIALVMMLVIVWAAMQVNDPLSAFVHTDKMRHILAFGALGLCAAFMPTTKWRIVGLATVITFGMLVEIIQIPVPDRTASLSDLLASVIGSFGGFGLGSAATTVLELVRPSARSQPSPSQRD
jgi:VanZ family protein